MPSAPWPTPSSLQLPAGSARGSCSRRAAAPRRFPRRGFKPSFFGRLLEHVHGQSRSPLSFPDVGHCRAPAARASIACMTRREQRLSRPLYEGLPWLYIAVRPAGPCRQLFHDIRRRHEPARGPRWALPACSAASCVLLRRRDFRELRADYKDADSSGDRPARTRFSPPRRPGALLSPQGCRVLRCTRHRLRESPRAPAAARSST